MAEAKSKSKSEVSTPVEERKAPSEELVDGADEVQEAFDEAAEKGHFGADSLIANEEWSLESGPDSPDTEDARIAVAQGSLERRR